MNIWIYMIVFLYSVVPEEFQYDPVTKTYGDPTRRPEIKSSTIEFIAPAEYMVRLINCGLRLQWRLTN